MDQVSAGEAMRDGARTRRRQMRDKARAQRGGPSAAPDHYRTPEWLERSFVLPLTRPETSNVPNQAVPHHDDAAYAPRRPRVTQHATHSPRHRAEAETTFVRPPSEDVDFTRMIRRADLCRRMGRLSWGSANLAGVALIVFLLLASPVVLAAAIVFAVTALISLVALFGLGRAPIARLQR